MSLELIKKIIEEEISNILNYDKPSDVQSVEDAWAGGEDLVDPVEHVPADVPVVVEDPVVESTETNEENGPIVKIDMPQLKSIIDECISNDHIEVDSPVDDEIFPAEDMSDTPGVDQSAKTQLYQSAKNAHAIYQMINEKSQLPDWAQTKLIRAADYLQDVYNHLDHEKNSDMEIISEDQIT